VTDKTHTHARPAAFGESSPIHTFAMLEGLLHQATGRGDRQETAPVHQNLAVDRSSDSAAALACAALELVASVAEAAGPRAAGVACVNRLKSFLGAQGVALGLSRRGARGCRLAAIAGAAEVNRGSELSREVERLLDEAFLCGDESTAAWRGGVPWSKPSSASGANALREALDDALVISHRLQTPAGTRAGALVIWGRRDAFDERRAQQLLDIAGESLAGALRLQATAKPGWLRRCMHKAFGVRHWPIWGGAALAVLLVMLWLPYRMTCDCSAEPLKRRFVAAPFAGVFEKSLVRPGDEVAQGQVLGQMDGRELRIELAAVTADYERVRKSHDVNLAADKVAAAQIDKLELERLDLQRKLLEYRQANLEIKSPVAGYVISGDMKRTEGAPLTVGQVLYEIAPLEEMIVEVAIDDGEVAHVEEGQEVLIRFEAHAGDDVSGRLTRLHPRSETRDSRNVFIGEVTLDDASLALRPGMNGKAQLVVDQSLLLGLTKRAWHGLTSFVGW
jgi:biotin carboxyl carrier protein